MRWLSLDSWRLHSIFELTIRLPFIIGVFSTSTCSDMNHPDNESHASAAKTFRRECTCRENDMLKSQ